MAPDEEPVGGIVLRINTPGSTSGCSGLSKARTPGPTCYQVHCISSLIISQINIFVHFLSLIIHHLVPLTLWAAIIHTGSTANMCNLFMRMPSATVPKGPASKAQNTMSKTVKETTMPLIPRPVFIAALGDIVSVHAAHKQSTINVTDPLLSSFNTFKF